MSKFKRPHLLRIGREQNTLATPQLSSVDMLAGEKVSSTDISTGIIGQKMKGASSSTTATLTFVWNTSWNERVSASHAKVSQLVCCAWSPSS
eukprot:CAMPEP_0181022628 /NCGR_PEP_ID=MMETSP1070-20121207/1613_1 /TAXON_ID=265543 /ORGANISM="Minutocellus polymorphus, Strain NH13" /LENGTH=91 /DNA_ID=CAMNT_0023099577 /DNA_START=311 /DNA_END=583 /DNA_ORIENTATION=-